MRQFIRHSLARAWALLLRSMPRTVRDLARQAEPSPELFVSASTKATVASAVVAGYADDVPAVVRQAADESYARFSSGSLFSELARVGDSNAVLAAHITERGAREAEHFIAVYPG